MNIYNVDALNRNSRFLKALGYGLPVSILSGIAYGLITSLIHIEFSFIFIGIGYAIGTVVQKYGKGFTTRFCVLAAVLTVLAIILGDLISSFGLNGFLLYLRQPSLWPNILMMLIRSYASLNPFRLLGLFFRVSAVVYAYREAIIF